MKAINLAQIFFLCAPLLTSSSAFAFDQNVNSEPDHQLYSATPQPAMPIKPGFYVTGQGCSDPANAGLVTYQHNVVHGMHDLDCVATVNKVKPGVFREHQVCHASIATTKGEEASPTDSSDVYITVLSTESFSMSSAINGNTKDDSTFVHCPNMDKDL